METDKKELILNRAIALFALRGYESVGVQQICEACQITKPTLYYYFENKLGLFKEIFSVYGEKLFRSVSDAFAESEEFPQCLSKIISSVLAFAEEHPDFFTIYYSLSTSSLQTESGLVFSEYRARIDALFFRIFQKHSEIFGNMRGYESMYSRIFQSTLNFSVFNHITGSMKLDGETQHRLVQTFLWGVAN